MAFQYLFLPCIRSLSVFLHTARGARHRRRPRTWGHKRPTRRLLLLQVTSRYSYRCIQVTIQALIMGCAAVGVQDFLPAVDGRCAVRLGELSALPGALRAAAAPSQEATLRMEPGRLWAGLPCPSGSWSRTQRDTKGKRNEENGGEGREKCGEGYKREWDEVRRWEENSAEKKICDGKKKWMKDSEGGKQRLRNGHRKRNNKVPSK